MHRIIAGATGLIGTQLVNHWLSQGMTVTVVGRSRKAIQSKFNNRVNAVEWQELHVDHFKQVDLVINLAGAGVADKRWSEARKQEMLNSRIDATTKIVSLLQTLGTEAPALFNASAIGVYGLQKQQLLGLPPRLDEETVIDFDMATDFLSKIAIEWEKATQPAIQAGVRVVNLRFGVVLSREGGALPMIAKPFTFYMGGQVGAGQQPFSWVVIDDLIRAVDFLMAHPEMKGPVNIVAPGCVTQRDFAKSIAKVLHKPCMLTTPAWVLKFVFGEMANSLLLEGQYVYPKRLLETGFQFSYPDAEPALKYLLG